MNENVIALAEKLRSEGEKTQQFFEQLKDEDWQALLYADGANWRVREILAHFLITEIGIPQIIRRVLAGGSGTQEGFNLDEFNQRNVRRLENLDPPLLLDRFRRQRQETIRLVNSLEDEDLRKVGRHPYLGEVPLVDMIKLLYRHNQIHQRDIRRALAVLE